MTPCLFLGVLYLRLSVFKGWRSTQRLMKTACGEDTRASLKHLEAGRPAEAVQSATPGSAFPGSSVHFRVLALPAALRLLIFCPSGAFARMDPTLTSNPEPTNLVLLSQLTRLISGLLGWRSPIYLTSSSSGSCFVLTGQFGVGVNS